MIIDFFTHLFWVSFPQCVSVIHLRIFAWDDIQNYAADNEFILTDI